MLFCIKYNLLFYTGNAHLDPLVNANRIRKQNNCESLKNPMKLCVHCTNK